MLQKIRGLFEANDVEVIMVDKPIFYFENDKYRVRSYKIDVIQKIEDTIKELSLEDKLQKIGLYKIEKNVMPDDSAISIIYAIIETQEN